ncbi:MAG TPA: cytochrome c [Polyangiaceae bacterium]|nr:cytochrome c [Polyangiaceae bacterium]
MKGVRYVSGRQFVQKYCAGCHSRDGQDPKRGVAYPAFRVDTYDDWLSSRTILSAVLDKWNPDGDVMPPPDAMEPSDEERRTILAWIGRNSPNRVDGN